MRDLVILVIFSAGLVFALRNPFVGLIVYMWISVMNPHRYAWGVSYTLPLAMLAAAVTMFSTALHLDQIRFPRTRESVLFLVLWAWITLTTVYAFYPQSAWDVWTIVTKIFAMTLVAMLLITTPQRLVHFLLALVGFVGFLALKGAIFGVITRGQYRVWGPAESFLADNNSAALAVVMMIPFCFFMRSIVKAKWQSGALLGVGLAMIISVVLSYSRGGLLGLAAVGTVSWWYSKRKVLVGLAAVVIVTIGMTVVPSAWFDRMSTIKTYDEDRSARMRINSWTMSFNLAKANPLGGGFDCFTMDQYYKYAPEPELGKLSRGAASTAHSIYFEVLAMHGFGGFVIYVSCLLFALLSMRKVRRYCAKTSGGSRRVALSHAFSASIIGFMVSGAFLSRAFFDLFWSVFAAAVCFKSLVLSDEWYEAPMPEGRESAEVKEKHVA